MTTTTATDEDSAESWFVDGMVGLYFHTLNEDGTGEWQGCVVGKLPGDRYLVQLCEWLLGQPTILKIVSLDQMTDTNRWQFYRTREEMLDEYDHVISPRQERIWEEKRMSDDESPQPDRAATNGSAGDQILIAANKNGEEAG